ncbi:MAG: thermonuclease family protein, partial [Pseudomonadota bacterium]
MDTAFREIFEASGGGGFAPWGTWAARSDGAARIVDGDALVLDTGQSVRLYYAGLTRDRYDRALAHAVTDDDLGQRFWLNGEMAAKGGARVRIYPDTALGSDALVTAETAARESGLGLWARDAYAVRRASDLGEDVFRFQVVDGILGDTEPSEYGACERAMLSSWLRLE